MSVGSTTEIRVYDTDFDEATQEMRVLITKTVTKNNLDETGQRKVVSNEHIVLSFTIPHWIQTTVEEGRFIGLIQDQPVRLICAAEY